MTDLIRRLREPSSVRSWEEADKQREEAAERIEQLECELKLAYAAVEKLKSENADIRAAVEGSRSLIKALQDESTALKESIEQGYLPNEIQLEDWAEKLRAENAALRDDAERYRWLRGNFTRILVETDPIYDRSSSEPVLLVRSIRVNYDLRQPQENSVDAAIDEVRQK